MDSVNFNENAKKEDGGPVLQPKKPRVLSKNLTEEQKLARAIDFAQARRDYIKRYYKENEEYRAACKERARVFSKNYYHSNPDYKQKVIERAKATSKLKYVKKSSTKPVSNCEKESETVN
jgi:hypothetical protein